MLLYLQVLMWSPLLISILIILLNATPSSSSFFDPQWTMNNEIPKSGRDCQALIYYKKNKLIHLVLFSYLVLI